MFHFTCSSGDNLPSGLQDWDNASVPQIHCQYVLWWSGVGEPMSLVINAPSILLRGLCQQPYNGTRQLNLCKSFPPLEHAGRVSSLFKEKSLSFWRCFELIQKCRCCLNAVLQGKTFLFFMFSKLIIEEEKKKKSKNKKLGKVQICWVPNSSNFVI